MILGALLFVGVFSADRLATNTPLAKIEVPQPCLVRVAASMQNWTATPPGQVGVFALATVKAEIERAAFRVEAQCL